ncbi:MAG: hypothetical protein LR001_02530 [Clostridiales bacterium]|nr:hypothetical protein [Clostridiales bacterium]
MATSIFAVFYITFKNKFDKRWRKYVSYILLGNIFTIVGLLLLPLLGMLSIFSIYVWLFVFSLVASVTLYTVFCKKPLETILYASSTVTLLLIADILTGLGLTTNSILGYVLIIGARYYGIGNEFSGILIAATLIVATSFLEALKKTNNSNSQARARGMLVVVVLFVIVVITLGFPSFGANVGATITACSAFLYVVFKLNNVEMNVKTIFLIFLLTALGIGIFLCFDYFVLDRRSHLAASFEHILLNGLQVAYQIIRRKIATNLRIIGITVWSRLLLIALLIMGVLLYRPMGVARNILTKYPYMAIGWSGILVSCVVGFMFNDSGVVIASTSVIFLSTSVLYLIVND